MPRELQTQLSGHANPGDLKDQSTNTTNDQLENSDAMDNRSFRGRQVDSVQGQGEGPHTCHKHNELHNDRVVMEEGTCKAKRMDASGILAITRHGIMEDSRATRVVTSMHVACID